jgi:hypothetical protein
MEHVSLLIAYFMQDSLAKQQTMSMRELFYPRGCNLLIIYIYKGSISTAGTRCPLEFTCTLGSP